MAPTPPHQEDLLLLGVSEGQLRDLHQHGKGRLLEGGADVGQIVFFRRLSRGGGEAGEEEVHPLDHVGKWYVLFGGPGQSLELGTAGVGEPRLPGELVQGVSDRDVQGLAELFDEEQ